MKRSWLGGVALASVVLSVGLAGCGGAGMEEGMPKDPNKADIPLDPKMVDVTGKMGAGAARKAQQEASKAQQSSPSGGAPAGEK